MTPTRPRVLSVLPLALLAFFAFGCGGGDGIESYKAPKSTDSGRLAPEPEPEVREYRILGAMYPADAPEWFFKFPGPAEQLNKYEADFDKLIASVSLPANGTPEFTTPEGWKRGPGRAGIVIATVRTPDGKYEVSVSSAQGDVVGNVHRWSVEQLGNASFGREDMPKATRPVEAKGVKGLRVDVRGPKKPPMGGGGPMMGGKK